MLGEVVQHCAVERNGRVQGNGRVEDSGTGSETQVPDGTRDEPGAAYAMQYATVRDTFAAQKTQRESRQDRAGGRPRRLVECRERVDLTYDERLSSSRVSSYTLLVACLLGVSSTRGAFEGRRLAAKGNGCAITLPKPARESQLRITSLLACWCMHRRDKSLFAST